MTASLLIVCDAIDSRHQFGPEGGAFGRSRKCDWVLPDQDRHLSSVHARIVYQNGTFVLVDESTNGTFVDGQPAPIGRGKAISLTVGMTLLAGPYRLRVEGLQNGSAAQTNPFTGLQANSYGRPAAPAAPLRIDTSGASLPKAASLDPLDHLGGGGTEMLHPVASVQTPVNAIPEPVAFSAAPAPVTQHETTRFQAVQPQVTPPATEVLPLGPRVPSPVLPPQGLSVAPTPAAAPAGTETPAAGQTPPVPTGPAIPEDFLAGLGASTAAPSLQQGLPELAALLPTPVPGGGQGTVPPPPATIPDDVDFGLGAPPAATPAPATPEAATPAATGQAPRPPAQAAPAPVPPTPAGLMPAAPAPAAAISEPPLDPLDALKKRRAQREAELAQKARSRVPPQAPAGPASPPSAQMPPVQSPGDQKTDAMPPAAMPPAAMVPSAMPAPPGAGVHPEVFQALLSGLGFADADVPVEEQAEIARAAGEMVRELANGLIALLAARKSLKTEFRMYETRIQPEENNPFKHYNVGELAIDEMLFARKGGFLPPSEAAKEAFKDLQSHTMLTVAATQRAMRILFESLSPETLAGEEDDGGLRLRGLGSRRGKWEAAKDRHDRLREDFDAVVRQTIAEAFVQVEEDQARQQSQTFWENRNK